MRRTAFIALACTAVALLAASACGGDSDSSATATTVAADVTVHATDALKFDSKSYSATAHGGEVTLQLVDDSGSTHSLVIDGKSGFRLQVNGHGDSDHKSVALAPGTYTIYCDIPGHRQAGMEATLTVS